jgi:YVTN family beta-propeller protein
MSALTRLFRALPLLCATAFPSLTQTNPSSFVNFEGALTSPIRLSPDGTRLFSVNNPNSTVSVFDVSTNPAKPALLAEIPVGIEPVSVNPRTDDEVWVVNQESDSVSIVSVSQTAITDTIQVKDEPSDVVFAGNYAFVSVARNNLINVYNVNTHAIVKSIPVFGGGPRQMVVSPDGSTVYAAFALSGNASTEVPQAFAPPPPPPVNPVLPPAPAQGIIVAATDPNWTSVITWTMPDNDVVAISSSTLAITQYYSGVGTENLGIAVQPSTGNLYVTNTDALNLIRFETALNGHFVNNRLSKITPSGTVTAFDLNPTVKYTGLPDPGSVAVALAQPAGIVFDGSGQNMYIAAFGTDRVAQVDPNGNILARIEIDPQAVGSVIAPGTKRGPRGLAINTATNELYVMNRISNTISVINTATNAVTEEIRTGTSDPTPNVIRQGRGFLYDAKLSGNGTGSCASCHLDGEGDHLGWDLGDPTGSMFPIVMQNGKPFQEHPMKGPMTTLTLRGLVNQAPYHWRGDKPAFSNFNVAFQQLMGGNQISTPNMTAFTNFTNTITYMPNPYQNLDRSYPTSLNGGNAVNGQQEFSNVAVNAQGQTCNSCHLATNYGSNLKMLILGDENQPMKNTPLRATYQKQLFSKNGATIDGFGFLHDGVEDSLKKFLGGNVFPLLNGKYQEQFDLGAFNLSIDSGMPPVVGYMETLTAAALTTGSNATNWSTMESQAVITNCDLVAHGTVAGARADLLFNTSSQTYQALQPGVGPFTHAQLLADIQSGSTVTFISVPYGSGTRLVAGAKTP